MLQTISVLKLKIKDMRGFVKIVEKCKVIWGYWPITGPWYILMTFPDHKGRVALAHEETNGQIR